MTPKTKKTSKSNRKEYLVAYYAKHKHEIKEKNATYYRKHKKTVKARVAIQQDVHKDEVWAKRLWTLYRLTPEDFNKLMAAQGGTCAISGKSPVNFRLNIDHRHSDGLIRGLITMTMNKGLGYFNDDPALLRAAADYLENPPAIQALGRKVYGLIGQAKVKRIMKYGPKG